MNLNYYPITMFFHKVFIWIALIWCAIYILMVPYILFTHYEISPWATNLGVSALCLLKACFVYGSIWVRKWIMKGLEKNEMWAVWGSVFFLFPLGLFALIERWRIRTI